MSEILGEALEFDLGRGTIVVVPTEGSPVSSVNGKIGDVELDWSDVGAMELLDPVPTVWETGGLYADTGIEFSSAATARTGFISVIPGGAYVFSKDAAVQSFPVSVFEYTSNAATTAQNSNYIQYAMFYKTPAAFRVGENTRYIRFRVNAPVSVVSGKMHLWASADLIPHGKRTYETLSEMLRDNSLVPGVRVETLGFDAEGDFGGGVYEIVSDVTANNCTIFELQNGYFAKRVFTEKWVYLESLNVQNVSFATINALLLAAGVKNVRFADLTLNKPIKLGCYDLDFDTLNYTGTGFAIEIDTRTDLTISGNKITAAAGSGIYVTESGNDLSDPDQHNTVRNHIKIRYILVKDTGVLVKPFHSRGIMYNSYEIGYIRSYRYGFRSYIPALSATQYKEVDGELVPKLYSWQGEECVSIGNIKCAKATADDDPLEVGVHDDDPLGIGVSLVIDESIIDATATNEKAFVDAGTISGVTFAHLAVEYSNIGMEIRSAPSGAKPNGKSPYPGQEPGIKSIVVNDMRCREYTRTDLFLKASGYLKDIYIRPTSPVQLCQWQITNTARDVGCFIDAPVYEHSPYVTIGSGIRSIRGITYVAGEEYHPMTITGNTDFSVMGRRALYARTALDSPTEGKLYFFFPETSDSEWHRTKSNDDAYVSYTYDGGATWTSAVSLDGQVPATSGLFIAKHFELDASRAGQTTSVNMAYYYKESASDLMFKLPAAAIGPENATMTTALKLTFDDINDGGRGTPAPYTVTLLNRDTQADHLYSVSVMTKFSDMKDIAVVRDLGPVS